MAISSINLVNASEYPEITNDVEIRYKWYKEVTKGDYYPLKDITKEDKIDITNIRYGNYSAWKEEYCSLSSKYYEISKSSTIMYKKVEDIRYVLIENLHYDDNIKIYHNNTLIDFDIISNEGDSVKIDLNKKYISETLLFYIDSDENYKIGLYAGSNFSRVIISKTAQNEKITSPDQSWTNEKTTYINYYSKKELKESDLTTKLTTRYECRYREKYVYKYETKKEYYNDEYHLNIEGYIKDLDDYKIYYKGEPITNTIEITKEKIIKEPQIEYVYIEPKKEIQENDSSKDINCIPKVKTEILEKKIEVYKIPKIIYIGIFLLMIIIIFLSIKLYKKYVA